MNVHELMKNRRSVRSFQPKPVPLDVLERMVDAARLAPTGANLQPLRYLVVTEPELRGIIFPTLRWAAYINPAGNPPAGREPAAYVIVLVDERAKAAHYKYDVGFSVENMLIAGLAEGVASCVLLSFNPQTVTETFHLPDYLRPDLVVALGYPDEEPVYVDRGDTVRYWRDEQGRHFVPKKPLDEVMFVNKL